MNETKRKILITKNARMITEKRLKFYSLWLNIGVSFSSLLIVFISIIILLNPNYDKNHYLTFVLLFYSQFICIISLIIWQRNFENRAKCFRKCYLKLDEIIDKYEHDELKLNKKYHSILRKFENHERIDNLEARLDFNRKNISKEEKYNLHTLEKIEYYIKKYSIIILYILIILLPIILFFISIN